MNPLECASKYPKGSPQRDCRQWLLLGSSLFEDYHFKNRVSCVTASRFSFTPQAPHRPSECLRRYSSRLGSAYNALTAPVTAPRSKGELQRVTFASRQFRLKNKLTRICVVASGASRAKAFRSFAGIVIFAVVMILNFAKVPKVLLPEKKIGLYRQSRPIPCRAVSRSPLREGNGTIKASPPRQTSIRDYSLSRFDDSIVLRLNHIYHAFRRVCCEIKKGIAAYLRTRI